MPGREAGTALRRSESLQLLLAALGALLALAAALLRALHAALKRMPLKEKLPTYPVINATPTSGAVLLNWGGGEYFKVVSHTVAGACVGFACGAPLRRHGCYFLATIGFGVGCWFAQQNSYFRLRGTLPNHAECRRAGVEFVDPYAPGGSAYPRAYPTHAS